jgi:hypothetical protein
LTCFYIVSFFTPYRKDNEELNDLNKRLKTAHAESNALRAPATPPVNMPQPINPFAIGVPQFIVEEGEVEDILDDPDAVVAVEEQRAEEALAGLGIGRRF